LPPTDTTNNQQEPTLKQMIEGKSSMPKTRQVGGMQEVFLLMDGKTLGAIERTIKAVEKLGGRALHVYPPAVMVASVPADSVGKLRGAAGISAARTEPFAARELKAAGTGVVSAMAAWNEHVSVERCMRMLASPTGSKSWGAAQMQPPDPPREILDHLRQREQRLLGPRAAARAEGAPNLSVPVLIGRVAVGLVFVDSTVSQYSITNQEKLKVVSETTEGLNLLASFEPRANIQWFYDIKRPKLSLAASQFTTANQNSWEDLWRDAAMGAMGYAANITGMNKYISDIKQANNAQWAYALFVTKHPKFWFAYYWGNHVVMDFAVDGWGIDEFHRVAAHETGHVFGCADEYGSSGCTCTSVHGRYQVANGNCETCATNFVPCLMAHNTPAVCDYTRGQFGWNELAVQSKGSTVLKGTWTFDFDTGTQGPATGADIWWRQVNSITRLLVPQSGAMLAHMGKPNFDAVSYQTLQKQSYTATSINGSNNAANQLKAGTVIAIKTNAGRYAKMRIDNYGYNLGITWVTYK
jgi:hypothetical protein